MNDIEEPVSVILISNAEKKKVKPYKVLWRNREYKITEVAMHQLHTRKGILWHVFSVMANNVHMVLGMNTQTLQWSLDKIG